MRFKHGLRYTLQYKMAAKSINSAIQICIALAHAFTYTYPERPDGL